MCSNSSFTRDSLFIRFLFTYKNMITWWYWPTYLFLSFIYIVSVSLESMLDIVHHTEILYQPGSTTLVIIFIHYFPFSIFVISSITNPGSCHQDPIIIVFPVHALTYTTSNLNNLEWFPWSQSMYWWQKVKSQKLAPSPRPSTNMWGDKIRLSGLDKPHWKFSNTPKEKFHYQWTLI